MKENRLKSIVKAMEDKLLVNHCEDCTCDGGCAKMELNEAINSRLKILKGNKTILK